MTARTTGWTPIPGGPRGSRQTEDGYRIWPIVGGRFVLDGPDGREIGSALTWTEVQARVAKHRGGNGGGVL